MGTMRYKPSDKVRIKSIDWYNENKDENGNIDVSHDFTFYADRSKYCGKVFTIVEVFDNCYAVKEDNNEYYWSDEMIEGLVEEETKNNNDLKEKETLLGWVKESDNLRLVPHKDYEIKQDGDNFYLVKKKKEYPKTYEECCKVLNLPVRDLDILDNMLDTTEIIYSKNLDRLLNSFRKLLICRDAYWKIAGEEMGLGKPWEPDWKNSEERRYSIVNIEGDINLPEKILTKWILKVTNKILVFPTEEMRDAFYENFDKDLEFCKELL